jgi:hypothetical protein
MKSVLVVSNYGLESSTYGGPVKSIGEFVSKMNGFYRIDLMYKKSFFNVKIIKRNIEQNTVIHFILNYKIYQKYDVIYLNSFFSPQSILIVVLKRIGFINKRIIIAPRGELSRGALSLKTKKKYLYLYIAKIISLYKRIEFHVTSELEKKEFCDIFHNTVWNIPNLITYPDIQLNNKKKMRGKLRILFLSRITKKKKLDFSLDLLLKNNFDGDIVFDIYGPVEDVSYWKACQKKIELINKISNIKALYKGVVKANQVYDVLNKYDCFILPTLNENFGHVIVEAMQCGVIPLLSDKTPWSDLNKYDAGWSINILENNVFIKAIQEMIYMNKDDYYCKSNNTIEYINSKLNTNLIQNKYIKMLDYATTNQNTISSY